MDVTKTYRNIYIKEGIVPKFSGKNLVYYTNKVVYNASESLVKAEYDRSKDGYISCGCDFKNIQALIKKN